MNTTEAYRIHTQLLTAPSVLSGRAKQTRATKARTMPRIPSLLTRSFRKTVERRTVTMGATEIIGITRYAGA